MSEYIDAFLWLYFAVFFGVAMVWRTYRVWQQSGVNAFRLREESGPEAVTGRYFKLFPLITVLVLLLHSVWPDLYRELGPVSALEISGVAAAGIGLMLVSLIWTVLAQVQMGRSWRIGIDYQHKTSLVTAGIFRYSRNPIFVGMMAALLGLFLVLPCALTLVALVLTIVLIQVQVSLEEGFLSRQHGDEYADYCRRVPRWLL